MDSYISFNFINFPNNAEVLDKISGLLMDMRDYFLFVKDLDSYCDIGKEDLTDGYSIAVQVYKDKDNIQLFVGLCDHKSQSISPQIDFSNIDVNVFVDDLEKFVKKTKMVLRPFLVKNVSCKNFFCEPYDKLWEEYRIKRDNDINGRSYPIVAQDRDASDLIEKALIKLNTVYYKSSIPDGSGNIKSYFFTEKLAIEKLRQLKEKTDLEIKSILSRLPKGIDVYTDEKDQRIIIVPEEPFTDIDFAVEIDIKNKEVHAFVNNKRIETNTLKLYHSRAYAIAQDVFSVCRGSDLSKEHIFDVVERNIT